MLIDHYHQDILFFTSDLTIKFLMRIPSIVTFAFFIIVISFVSGPLTNVQLAITKDSRERVM